MRPRKTKTYVGRPNPEFEALLTCYSLLDPLENEGGVLKGEMNGRRLVRKQSPERASDSAPREDVAWRNPKQIVSAISTNKSPNERLTSSSLRGNLSRTSSIIRPHSANGNQSPRSKTHNRCQAQQKPPFTPTLLKFI
jgi:hypothetical protein